MRGLPHAVDHIALHLSTVLFLSLSSFIVTFIWSVLSLDELMNCDHQLCQNSFHIFISSEYNGTHILFTLPVVHTHALTILIKSASGVSSLFEASNLVQYKQSSGGQTAMCKYLVSSSQISRISASLFHFYTSPKCVWQSRMLLILSIYTQMWLIARYSSLCLRFATSLTDFPPVPIPDESLQFWSGSRDNSTRESCYTSAYCSWHINKLIASIELSLSSNPYTRRVWSHALCAYVFQTSTSNVNCKMFLNEISTMRLGPLPLVMVHCCFFFWGRLHR